MTICDPKNIVAAVSLGHRGDSCFLPVDTPFDWSDHSHSVAFTAKIRRQGLLFHLIVNAFWEPLEFELPLLSNAGNPWRRWVATPPHCFRVRERRKQTAGEHFVGPPKRAFQPIYAVRAA